MDQGTSKITRTLESGRLNQRIQLSLVRQKTLQTKITEYQNGQTQTI